MIAAVNDGQDEEASLRAGEAAGEEGAAHGMRREEMALNHKAAVGGTVEEGLRPVPRRVEADGPPERAGAPQAEAEDDSDERGGEQADGRLAGVGAVDEAESEGEQQGRGPKAGRGLSCRSQIGRARA
jgi:hypothetical protein